MGCIFVMRMPARRKMETSSWLTREVSYLFFFTGLYHCRTPAYSAWECCASVRVLQVALYHRQKYLQGSEILNESHDPVCRRSFGKWVAPPSCF
jgi:hypothetical protein